MTRTAAARFGRRALTAKIPALEQAYTPNFLSTAATP